MKSISDIKQYLAVLMSGLFMSVGCQYIPDVEEMIEDIPETQDQTSTRYEKLISEVDVVLTFSVSNIGTMIYQFTYDDLQRVTGMKLTAEYAEGQKYNIGTSYGYYPQGCRIIAAGTDLYLGYVNGSAHLEYGSPSDSFSFDGFEYTPEYSFGRNNNYFYEDGHLKFSLSNKSGDGNLNFSREYTWRNGNIVREYTSDGETSLEISYSYTDHIDKCNLDILKLSYYLNYYKGLYFTADKVAFKGLSSKNLPAEQIQFIDEETYTFEYEFDEDHYVKTVYIYMDGELMQIMYIKYIDADSSGDNSGRQAKISDIMIMPDYSHVVLNGTVIAVTQRGFLLRDDTDLVYVYGGPQWEVCVNVTDKVEVYGLLSTYWNNREIILNGLNIIGSDSVSTMAPYKLAASNILSFAQARHKPCLVTVEGVLTYDGQNYNIIAGDNSVTPSVEFPIVDLSGYLNKPVKLTGYYLWTSTSDDNKLYMDIILTDIEEIK